ncbi:hypothetical protein HYFRA_00002004 [Hymenoscyphus fraxineus]|uniref:Alpha/beta hydrolase fold-3 domain-containing protein n=1 Tax=Hymenoscyphus fraxineus TaxID=746836 RepID=A0A9N9KJR5_9HELO|nr:hypothetical protein HYFRA_00002004 [Hymenoscyphus fraxineus]
MLNISFSPRAKFGGVLQQRCMSRSTLPFTSPIIGPSKAIPCRQLMRRESYLYAYANRRRIHTALVPPIVFGSLVVTLWTWKCLMMILFQNKIIYMPGLPPNARRERIEDYKNQCGGVVWREEKIKSLDGTRISLCIAGVEHGGNTLTNSPLKTVYILYFQGNASSLPPRLPFLSPILRILKQRAVASNHPIKYVLVCCSYRGYWTSNGRPSEKGIALDALASLQWIATQATSSPTKPTPFIIWGQSIGAGVASALTSSFPASLSKSLPLKALILETPFLSIRAMLQTLYPQKWLPYRYLWPFLRNHLDAEKALGVMSERWGERGEKTPKVWILQAGRDELVPAGHAERLEGRFREVGVGVERRVIGGALHTEVLVRAEGAGRDELVPAGHAERLEGRFREVGVGVERRVIGGALHTEVLVRAEGVRAVVEAVEEVAREGWEVEKG